MREKRSGFKAGTFRACWPWVFGLYPQEHWRILSKGVTMLDFNLRKHFQLV